MSSTFKSHIIATLEHLKSAQEDISIPILVRGKQVGVLRPITLASLAEQPDAALVTAWRKKHYEAYMTWFTATETRSSSWLKDQVISRSDRILFMIEIDREPFGHMGLTNFDFVEKSCEVDNVVRGRTGLLPGGMTLALQTLIGWAFAELKVELLFLKVFSDNQRAISLYGKCGFAPMKQIPLQKIEQESQTQWIELPGSKVQAEKYTTYMRLATMAKAGDI